MRTTLEINDQLFREAKKRAAAEGSSLRELVERALRALLHKAPGRERYRLRWSTEKGRLLPGALLEDRDALFDLMEDRR